jgi:hypothetical protein
MTMPILTVNSISGGKTSSYMATHYPSDINVFACVLTNDKSCLPSDKGLLREIQDKLPQFEGSKELDQTLINVLKVEWRYPVFPLIENNVTHETIVKYWKDQNWIFPSVSNCDFCFNHTPQQLKEQKELFPNRLQWWEDQEAKLNKTFGNKPINQVISDYGKSNNAIPAFSCVCTD